MHQIKTYCFCLSQIASNINGKGCAGINAPLTLALSVIRGSQAEHKDILLRTYLFCGILQIMASNKVFLYILCGKQSRELMKQFTTKPNLLFENYIKIQKKALKWCYCGIQK